MQHGKYTTNTYVVKGKVIIKVMSNSELLAGWLACPFYLNFSIISWKKLQSHEKQNEELNENSLECQKY